MIGITFERLKECVSYDPQSGEFTRLSCHRTDLQFRLIVNNRGGNGYCRITIDGVRYYAHRLAWFYMTSEWPQQEIDHINGKRLDNSWSNLREASRKENSQNMRNPRIDNQSGFLGVSWDRARLKWVARIKIEGLYKFLGRFSEKEDAANAYLAAKRKNHIGCTI